MAAYWGIAAHSAYDMFSWYKYKSVILVFFPPLGLWSGNFFLIASFLIIAYLYVFIHAAEWNYAYMSPVEFRAHSLCVRTVIPVEVHFMQPRNAISIFSHFLGVEFEKQFLFVFIRCASDMKYMNLLSSA